jgi:large subunit ribosomal protein L15
MVSRTNKFRGSRYHGRGKKSGRGAGKRGGRGNAGINKYRLLTRLKYMPRHWGMHGFNRHPSLRKVNISINLQELQDMTEEDTVNLGELGYDKLLGKGKMNRGMNITVAKASARAVSKVEAAGGTVTIDD